MEDIIRQTPPPSPLPPSPLPPFPPSPLPLPSPPSISHSLLKISPSFYLLSQKVFLL